MADLPLDVVDDVVADQNVAVGGHLGVDGGKDAAGAVVVYLQVVDADDPVVIFSSSSWTICGSGAWPSSGLPVSMMSLTPETVMKMATSMPTQPSMGMAVNW